MLSHACHLSSLGYTPVSVSLSWNHDKNKKELVFPFSAWQTASPCTLTQHPMVSDVYNGLMIVTGKASDVVVIDTDRAKPDEDLEDGLAHFESVLKSRGGLPANTMTAVSGSGGKHYMFSYSKSMAEGLSPTVVGKAKLVIDGKRASIDTRINNNCIVCAPTSYNSPKGPLSYEWLTPLLPASDLPPIPSWLIADLNRPATKRPARSLAVSESKRIKQMDIITHDHFVLCQPLLHEAGFRDTRMTRTKADGFDFVADRSCVCPLCNHHHDSNEWWSIPLADGCYQVRGYSSKCREKLLGLDNQPQLRRIFQNSQSDEPYCSIFASRFALGRHDKPIIWTGLRWLQFQNHLWKPVEPLVIRNALIQVNVDILERLAVGLKRMEGEADCNRDKEAADNTVSRYKATMKGLGYIGRGGNQRNILDCLKGKLFINVGEDPSGIEGSVTLDGDPYLLGCDNGVVDLKTCTLRPGRPEDWVSKSVRYEYQPTIEGNEFVEHTMAQTFPIAEERAFVQRYAGYCLLGKHPEKHYMVLTDMQGRRSGNNGKTTINKALRIAMGSDYSCNGISATLYCDGRMRDENACTPGKMFYRGVRFAAFDELDSRKRLDTTRLKNIHGGNTQESARDAYGKAVEEFDWTAKFLITFNSDQLPEVDPTDHVHLGRMLVIRCRSQFLDEASMTSDPHTFEKITDFADHLQQRRSDVLAWALAGLREYWTKGLREAPPVMEKWKQELSNSQDLVSEWIGLRLKFTGNSTDFVKRSDLYQDFKATVEEERDKRTAMGKTKFFGKLLLELGEERHRAQYKRDGINTRDVFLAWSFVVTE